MAPLGLTNNTMTVLRSPLELTQITYVMKMNKKKEENNGMLVNMSLECCHCFSATPNLGPWGEKGRNFTQLQYHQQIFAIFRALGIARADQKNAYA